MAAMLPGKPHRRRGGSHASFRGLAVGGSQHAARPFLTRPQVRACAAATWVERFCAQA